MAAAYLFHLVGNHPFVDGNKRIGLVAAIAFLGLNRLWLEADPDELAELVLRIARREAGKAEVAEFIRVRVVEAPDSPVRHLRPHLGGLPGRGMRDS